MNLFTVVADFAGGTYIAQIEAKDVFEAAKIWPNCSATTEVASLLELSIGDFSTALQNPTAEPVGSLSNCWCVTAELSDQLLILHIIKTERS